MVEYLLVSTLISTENTTTEPDQRSKKSSSWIWVLFSIKGIKQTNEAWVWSLFLLNREKIALKNDWDTKYDLIFIGQMVADYGKLFGEYGRESALDWRDFGGGVLTLWRQTLFEIIFKQRRSRAIWGFWIGLEVEWRERDFPRLEEAAEDVRHQVRRRLILGSRRKWFLEPWKETFV